MLASRTWAVQMFEVAFSRRMCCSRVCSASRSAGRPAVSVLTPTMRPGIARAARSWAARNPAWGPPNPIGTPKRCAEPMAMSAPSWPGGTPSTHASRSVATTTRPPASWICSITGRQSGTSPVEVGRLRRAPKHPAETSSTSPTTSSMPTGSARVASTAIVWGWVSWWTTNRRDSLRVRRRAIVIASAAAVASSSSEALVIGSPVSSLTIVWKSSSASSRPWLISGWYGVYAVYHAGSSSTLRRITAGRWVSVYPMPMRLVRGRFRSASRRSAAITAGSDRAGGRSNGVSDRIEAGTVWSSRSARDLAPRASSIRSRSASVGPMWRVTKSSSPASWARGVGVTILAPMRVVCCDPTLSSAPESFTRHGGRAFPVGEPGATRCCFPALPRPSGPLA